MGGLLGRRKWSLPPIGKERAAATAQEDRGSVRQTSMRERARSAGPRGRGRAGCYGHAINIQQPETPMNSHPTRRELLLQGAALGAAAASSTVLTGNAFA